MRLDWTPRTGRVFGITFLPRFLLTDNPALLRYIEAPACRQLATGRQQVETFVVADRHLSCRHMESRRI